MYYIVLVAILNLGLGFAVAVYLGRRYQTAVGSGGAPSGAASFAQPDNDVPSPAESAAPVAESPAEPAVEEALAAVDAESESPEPGSREPSPPRKREKSASEGSVQEFVDRVEEYHDHITQADDELRTCMEAPDAGAIETCLTSMLDATEEYFEERKAAQQKLEDVRQQPELAAIGENMQVAVQRQDEQIESTRATIEAFDYEGDLEDGCRRVVTETGKLIDQNHQLRDTLGEAIVEVNRSEQRWGDIDDDAQTDPLTELSNRTGLEIALFGWWENDSQRDRLLTVAMIDIDHFAQINTGYGHKVGDRVIRAVGQLVAAERRDQVTAARFSGQKFVLLFPDADCHSATNVVEWIRQSMEMTRFRIGESDVPITISCAITESTPEDTADTLFARAETTLQEAKRYGRNRTFLHEGKDPTPVVPPNFPRQEKLISI